MCVCGGCGGGGVCVYVCGTAGVGLVTNHQLGGDEGGGGGVARHQSFGNVRCLRGIREFDKWGVCEVSGSLRCGVFARYQGV